MWRHVSCWQRFVCRMGMLNIVTPLVLFNKSKLMSAPGFSFNPPHLTFISHTLHHNTTLTHTLTLDMFSYLQILITKYWPFLCRVQLVDAICNEYANERNGVGHVVSDNTLPWLRDWNFIREITDEMCCMHGKKKLSIYCWIKYVMGVCVLSYIKENLVSVPVSS